MRWWWIKLARFALPQTGGLVAIAVLMLVGIALGLLNPWPLKMIVDNVLSGEPLPSGVAWVGALPAADSAPGLLAWLAAATVCIFMLRRTVRIVQGYVQAGASSRMVYALAGELFDDVQRRSPSFHGKRRTGDLMRRVTSDTGCVRDLVMGIYVPVITSLVTLVSMFFVMWQLSRVLAVLATLMAVPLGLVARFFSRPMTERKYLEKGLQGELISHAEQTLSNVAAVQAFGRENHEDERFRWLSRRTVQAHLRAALSRHQFRVSTGALTATATATAMLIGGMEVIGGSLSVGSLLVLMTYFGTLFSSIESLTYLAGGFASAAASARRVFEILDSDDDSVREAPDAVPLSAGPPGRGAHVRLEAVTFGYEPGRPVLKGIDIELGAGECVALVGRTGSGKSTLISLLPRLFDPWNGKVLVNGVDVRGVTLSSLRNNIALVHQEPFLLPLSVAQNIAYGRPGASHQEIVTAARAAGADGFIARLPQGYDTVIGPRGATLSGGERQRLSIARALLKDAPILILDEPTSSLDVNTEAEIMEALTRLMRSRTTLIISHRMTTIRNADRVIALQDGHVSELGTYQELLAQGGDSR